MVSWVVYAEAPIGASPGQATEVIKEIEWKIQN
jgi:hypothetical protein